MQPTSGLGICGYGSFFLVCGEVPDMLEARVHADLDQPHAPVFVPIDALVSTGVPATLPSVLLVLAASSDTEITATKVERVPVAVISLPHVARPKFEQESMQIDEVSAGASSRIEAVLCTAPLSAPIADAAQFSVLSFDQSELPLGEGNVRNRWTNGNDNLALGHRFTPR